jgi:hypothetical protein
MGNPPPFWPSGLIHCLSKTFKELAMVFRRIVLLTMHFKESIFFSAVSEKSVRQIHIVNNRLFLANRTKARKYANFLEHSHTCEAVTCSAGQEIPAFHGTRSFITCSQEPANKPCSVPDKS